MRRIAAEWFGRFSFLGVAVALTTCQPPSPVGSSRVLSSAPAVPPAFASQTTPDAAPRAVAKLGGWNLVPSTRLAIHENIWVETAVSPTAAVALMVGNALSILGGSFDPAALVPASLPKHPVVTWQLRNPDFNQRVVMDLEVVLTRGYLEHFLSRSQAGKDHESIVSGPFDAELLKFALIGIGLKPGKPASFINEKREYDYKPATGDVVRIYVQYEDPRGQTSTVPAQSWVLGKDGRPLVADWVFAGSYRGKGQTFEGKEYEYFGANDGRVVCVTNFGSALLDLPVESADSDPQGNGLGYQAHTAVIPPLGTKLRVIFEPKKQ